MVAGSRPDVRDKCSDIATKVAILTKFQFYLIEYINHNFPLLVNSYKLDLSIKKNWLNNSATYTEFVPCALKNHQ